MDTIPSIVITLIIFLIIELNLDFKYDEINQISIMQMLLEVLILVYIPY